jgi:hypothetical protein
MASGKAYGEDREYQILCRDILKSVESSGRLTPYSDDGIDIKFEGLGGTDITFDIALSDPEGNIVVAECRRRDEPVKQEALLAFARKVELLRKQTERPVAGIFFAKSKYQIGAIKHASWSGIKVAILDQSHPIKNFILSYQRYDVRREKRIQESLAHLTGEISAKGTVSIIVMRGDGTVEDFGSVE